MGLTEANPLRRKDRLYFWAKYFIDRPYIENPLGEGVETTRFRTDGFDCMTYVETCLALAVSESPEETLKNLDRIRYRNGTVGFYTRCHFVSADWLPNNEWLLKRRDDLADDSVTRVIDRGKFFVEKGRPLSAGNPPAARERITLPFISKERITSLSPEDIGGSVAVFIGSLDWLIVRHMGLVFYENKIETLFHASSKAKKVERERFIDYITAQEKITGITLASLID